jgi:hypothetical protein
MHIPIWEIQDLYVVDNQGPFGDIMRDEMKDNYNGIITKQISYIGAGGPKFI